MQSVFVSDLTLLKCSSYFLTCFMLSSKQTQILLCRGFLFYLFAGFYCIILFKKEVTGLGEASNFLLF